MSQLEDLSCNCLLLASILCNVLSNPTFFNNSEGIFTIFKLSGTVKKEVVYGSDILGLGGGGWWVVVVGGAWWVVWV